MSDQNLREKQLPAWVVQQAVSHAIDQNVVGIESNGDSTYSVLIDHNEAGPSSTDAAQGGDADAK